MSILGNGFSGATQGITKNDNGTLRVGNRIPQPTPPKGEVIGDLWYDTSTLTLKVWTGSIWQPIAGGGGSISPPAYVGPSIPYTNAYASFDHTGRAYTLPGNYILLADTTNSFLNAPAGGKVFIRIDNSTRVDVGAGGVITYGAAGAEVMVADTNTVRSNFGFTMPQLTSMYFRGFGDTNHRIVVPSVASQFGTNFNVDGPCFVGFNNYVFATGNNGHWQLAVGANYIQVFGGLGVSNGSNNDINIDPESVTTVNTGSGISIRQRSRASNDGTNRVVMYATGDAMYLWQNVNMVRFAQGGNIHIEMGLPGGSDADTIVRIAGSNQLLKHTSTIKVKKDVLDVSRWKDDNPVWKMRPVTFKWNHRPQEELDRLDRLRPEGRSVGFIAEEMYELAPECVTFGPEDEPDGINEMGVIAYLVAGLQQLQKRLEIIEKGKAQ